MKNASNSAPRAQGRTRELYVNRLLGFPAVAFALTAGSPALALSYACKIVDLWKVETNGQLVPIEFGKTESREFTFDAATGTYRKDSIRWEFDVAFPGSGSNSLKAIRVFQGPADVVLQTLVIRTWSEGEFIFSWHGEIRTGKCRATLYEEQN